MSFTERGDQEFREGLVIRFHPESSDPWIGNFLGGGTNCTTVLDHPNETDVIVVANGNACVIDLERRAIRDRIGADITAVIPLPALGLVIFQGFVDFTAVRANGTGWVSPRISWDGFRNVKIHESVLSGEAWAPSIKDIWMPFTLDLLTGQCTDGVYGNDMARAVRVGP